MFTLLALEKFLEYDQKKLSSKLRPSQEQQHHITGSSYQKEIFLKKSTFKLIMRGQIIAEYNWEW